MIQAHERAEFEQLGIKRVRDRITASLYNENKQKSAYEWLDEVERGPDRDIARSARDAAWLAARAAQAAQAANNRATIALIIATVSAIATIIGIILPFLLRSPPTSF